MVSSPSGKEVEVKTWLIESLQNALSIWNYIQSIIIGSVYTSPQSFRDGTVWAFVQPIYGGLQAVGYALLVLFFVVGVIKTCGSFSEVKRPELAIKLFVRFAIAKGVITHGMEIMLAFLNIGQGIIRTVFNAAGLGEPTANNLPYAVIEAVQNSRFTDNILLLEVTLIGCLIIWVVSFVMIISVFGRIIKIFMYAAIAPIPLSTFAGEPTQNIGKSFLKSFAGVCIEGVIIVLACAVYSSFAHTSILPESETATEAATIVWNYLGSLLLNMLILCGTVKAADRVAREMMGL